MVIITIIIIVTIIMSSSSSSSSLSSSSSSFHHHHHFMINIANSIVHWFGASALHFRIPETRKKHGSNLHGTTRQKICLDTNPKENERLFRGSCRKSLYNPVSLSRKSVFRPPGLRRKLLSIWGFPGQWIRVAHLSSVCAFAAGSAIIFSGPGSIDRMAPEFLFDFFGTRRADIRQYPMTSPRFRLHAFVLGERVRRGKFFGTLRSSVSRRPADKFSIKEFSRKKL